MGKTASPCLRLLAIGNSSGGGQGGYTDDGSWGLGRLGRVQVISAGCEEMKAKRAAVAGGGEKSTEVDASP